MRALKKSCNSAAYTIVQDARAVPSVGSAQTKGPIYTSYPINPYRPRVGKYTIFVNMLGHMSFETHKRARAHRRLTSRLTPALTLVTIIALIRVVAFPPLWGQPRHPDQFEEVRAQWPEIGQVEDWMDHPLRLSRLLQVGEAEGPGRITRVDDVAHAEAQRLAPDDDLVANEGGQWAPLVLPPRIADVILIQGVVGEMAVAVRPY